MAEETEIDLGGRPPKYETPEELEVAIDEYIAKTPAASITLTGLCMHLGFASRQSLHDYKKRPGFSYPILKGLLAVENSYEISLRTIAAPGSIFALKNMGWTDKTQTELTGKDGGPVSGEVTLKIVRGSNTETE
jgi:hypothetical protein